MVIEIARLNKIIIGNDDKDDATLQLFSEQEHSSQYTPFS